MTSLHLTESLVIVMIQDVHKVSTLSTLPYCSPGSPGLLRVAQGKPEPARLMPITALVPRLRFAKVVVRTPHSAARLRRP